MKTCHLTATGIYAGQTYCGAERTEDCDYSHLPYGEITADFAARICPDCKAFYAEAVGSDFDADFVEVQQ